MNTPKIKTSDDYKNAIKARYEEIKNDLHLGSLLEPTPALLKQLCILKSESSGKVDLEVFDRFFAFKSSENKVRQIENFDTDRFRPLCNFLKGKTKSIQHLSLEVIAVLIEFETRPLNIYLKNSYEEKPILKKEDTPDFKVLQYESTTTDILPEDNLLKKTPRKKQLTLLLLATLYIAFISFLMSFIKYPSEIPENSADDKEYTMRIDYHFKTVKGNPTEKNENKAVFFPVNRQLSLKANETEADTMPFYSQTGTPSLWYQDPVYNNEVTVIDTPSPYPDSINSLRIAREIMENKIVQKKILQHINDYQIVNVEVEIGVSYIRM